MPTIMEFRAEGLQELLAKTEGLAEAAEAAMRIAAGEIAGYLEGYAKEHHPWQRRSGDTQGTTQGTEKQLAPYIFEVILSAGMGYDLFLELCRAGKWAWLWPAIEANESRICEILATHLRSIR